MQQNYFIWIIALLSIFLIILRPFKIAEAFWAVCGAFALLLFGFISPLQAYNGILKGLDVYLFLAGMMLLAEAAREENLFNWMAAYATFYSKGSAKKLFLLIYCVGIIITVFLSNDATAVVLTPAVAAAVKSAKVKNPLPYLLTCAFIANAASFVLPISNPANLVIYGAHMPSLAHWMKQFIIPSILSIVITYVALYFTQRKNFAEPIALKTSKPVLPAGGKIAAAGIIISAVVLLVSSALNISLGLPTAITGVIIFLIAVIKNHKNLFTVSRKISWSVLPLVAGLFVMVEALNNTGILHLYKNIFRRKHQKVSC